MCLMRSRVRSLRACSRLSSTPPGVPCGSVRDLREVFSDPQVSARDMITEVEHAVAGTLRLLGTPLKLSDTPGGVRTPPPRLGEHTEHVLIHDLGLDRSRVAALSAEGVV